MTTLDATAAPATDPPSFRTVNVVAAFCAVSSGVYGALNAQPSVAVAFFFWAAPLMAVILWLERDAARTQTASVYDFGFLLWFTWFLFIPWYTWRTRRRSRWRLMVFLFAVIWSAQLSWLIGAWGLYAIRYAIWYVQYGLS